MKRFTDTEKWGDLWFRKLPGKFKLFWLYVCDKCNNAGVWNPDFEMASFCIGEPITEEEAATALNGRIKKLPCGWLIMKFLDFQYGKLDIQCRPHVAILKTLDTLSIPYPIPYANGTDTQRDTPKTRQDKTRQDKIVLPEGGMGETIQPIGRQPDRSDVILKLKGQIGQFYKKGSHDRWEYDEEYGLVSICGRSNVEAEWVEIHSYYETLSDKSFFPRSAASIFQKWSQTLDAARMAVTSGKTAFDGYLTPEQLIERSAKDKAWLQEERKKMGYKH